MSKDFSLPGQGFVFWPVGTGDSVTVAIGKEAHLQIDIRQMESAREDETPYEPVVDRLVELLPKRNGKPYLACFVLSHPDMDHCQGFSELLKEVLIGELWFTPRIFREYKKDMCDDAVAFRNEAMRRVKKTIRNKGQATTGDRVRIIGYDDLREEEGRVHEESTLYSFRHALGRVLCREEWCMRETQRRIRRQCHIAIRWYQNDDCSHMTTILNPYSCLYRASLF